MLPPGYSLDRSDPEVLVVCCPHGGVVARFSTRGVTAEAVEEAAWKDHEERGRSA